MESSIACSLLLVCGGGGA
ncbi:hypothetical protein XELAEV_180167002mg, partial [Xenopus laevis]